MKVIKRDGKKVKFDKNRIEKAINAAFLEIDGQIYETDTAADIADEIENIFNKSKKDISVEQIQDLVEEYLMRSERKDVAKAYIRYRYKKEIIRETNKTYDGILKLVEMSNDELKEENSNKDAIVASTQRDYMAGEVSKDLSHRLLLPKEIIDAHDQGIIHFHDMDYFA